MGTRVSEDFQFWVSGSRNNQKHTALGTHLDYEPEALFGWPNTESLMILFDQLRDYW